MRYKLTQLKHVFLRRSVVGDIFDDLLNTDLPSDDLILLWSAIANEHIKTLQEIKLALEGKIEISSKLELLEKLRVSEDKLAAKYDSVLENFKLAVGNLLNNKKNIDNHLSALIVLNGGQPKAKGEDKKTAPKRESEDKPPCPNQPPPNEEILTCQEDRPSLFQAWREAIERQQISTLPSQNIVSSFTNIQISLLFAFKAAAKEKAGLSLSSPTAATILNAHLNSVPENIRKAIIGGFNEIKDLYQFDSAGVSSPILTHQHLTQIMSHE